MSGSLTELENLIRVAEEPSSEKRRALLEAVTDLFIRGTIPPDSREMVLATDILSQVMAALSEQVRGEMSERFADLDQVPADLIRQLANDVIQVAAPVLARSGVLGDADLIEIVNNRGHAHQLAITQRPTLSEAVSDALVENGDEAVLESLVRNEGAAISRRSMERIVAKSEFMECLHEPVVQRRDLPPDLAHEMFWWVGSTLKRLILENAEVDEALVDRALAESESQFMSIATADESSLSDAERQVQRMVRFGQLNPDTMLGFLSRGLVPEFIAALSHLTEVDTETARRIVFSPGHEALAIACRSAGFDANVFGALVRGLAQSRGAGTGDVQSRRELLELYEKTPFQTARRAMRFWRVRQQGLLQLSA